MNVIVFGGSGFIGSHTADALTEKGYKVKIFDIVKSPYIMDQQEMIVGDILNTKAVKMAVKGCDFVYNFAGMANVDKAYFNPIFSLIL